MSISKLLGRKLKSLWKGWTQASKLEAFQGVRIQGRLAPLPFSCLHSHQLSPTRYDAWKPETSAQASAWKRNTGAGGWASSWSSESRCHSCVPLCSEADHPGACACSWNTESSLGSLENLLLLHYYQSYSIKQIKWRFQQPRRGSKHLAGPSTSWVLAY